MADPISAAVIGAGATLAVGALAATMAAAPLAYQIGKDIHNSKKSRRIKAQNLEMNYKMLENELPKLVALKKDLDEGLITMALDRNTSTFATWKNKVAEIEKVVRDLFGEYNNVSKLTRKKKKASLSERMEEKNKKVCELRMEGKSFISFKQVG